MRAIVFRQQPPAQLRPGMPNDPDRKDAPYAPAPAPDPARELRQRNKLPHKTSEHSMYQAYQLRSTLVKTVLVGGALLAAWSLMRRPTRRKVWHA
jgi:hypothetical protein